MNYKDLGEFIKSRPWYAQWLVNVYAQKRTPDECFKAYVESSGFRECGK